jgi:hypothetical protein
MGEVDGMISGLVVERGLDMRLAVDMDGEGYQQAWL